VRAWLCGCLVEGLIYSIFGVYGGVMVAFLVVVGMGIWLKVVMF